MPGPSSTGDWVSISVHVEARRALQQLSYELSAASGKHVSQSDALLAACTVTSSFLATPLDRLLGRDEK